MLKKLNAAVLGLTVAALSAPAFAQTDPDAFETVLADVTTKVGEYAGALVVLAGVSVVFMIGVKYIKKLRGAA